MKRYQGYLFDLDGTLVDTAPDLMDALNFALNSVDMPSVDLNLTRQWVGFGGRIMLKQAIKSFPQTLVGSTNIETLYLRFLDYYQSQTSLKSQPYPTVVKTLETLCTRASRLAVVTNKSEHLAVKCLDELNLTRFFNVVVGGDTMQVAKPAPEPALYACNELETPVSNTLFVGDSMTDLECARNAGCDIAIHRSGYHGGTQPEAMGADIVYTSFDELL